ncbi:Na(+)-translocating NADH-quinone reductase subunit A [candidate division KSB1 bacterium]|nr:Na(+)-translocating NADH-quinone reductase subunit A [candidate division KSB1 bacterium]
MHKIQKGLDLPISGKPVQEFSQAHLVKTVALIGPDYVGMKPKFEVAVGEKVKLGQVLFLDKKKPGIKYTSPGAGKVTEINRGEKRAFLSIVIELDSNEEAVRFKSFNKDKLSTLKRDEMVKQLVESGAWTALRARPFGHVANPDTTPHSLFVTAMDSHPIAPVIEKVLKGRESNFRNGLQILAKLTDGKVFVCKHPNENIPVIDSDQVVVEEFSGPHPSGLPGTHIHFLDPVNAQKTVWHISAQDVAMIGKLFTTGELEVERVVAIGGPAAKIPRLIRTRIGASLEDLLDGEIKDMDHRIVSGSVFSGMTAEGPSEYLGRYHQQIAILPTDKERKFFGWLSLGFELFSIKPILISSLLRRKAFDFSTNLHGGKRSIVPIGMYEKVMPLDILPTFLLRALAVDDIDEIEKLGGLELVEEDLSLCTFVCPSKMDHGTNLRRVLTTIEKEG